MGYLILGSAVVGGIFFMHLLGVWMETKGLIYYRKKRVSSDGVGNALQELNALMNPSVRYVITEKKKDSRQRDDQGDGERE